MQDPLTENKSFSNIVHIINLNKHTCIKVSIDEILNPELLKIVDQEYAFLIMDPSQEAIIKIRKAYKLHPIIDYECSSSNLHAIDHMFKFDECLFITLIDIPESEDLTCPSAVKILLMKHAMIIIVTEPLPCIEKVFKDLMGFEIFNLNQRSESEELIRRTTEILRQIRRAPLTLQKVVVNESTGLGELESLIYKIIHVMFIGIEEFIRKMYEEVINCIDFVSNLSTSESTEFVVRMNHAQKNLSLCDSYVSKKTKLLPELIKTDMLSKTFSEYLISMSLNMNKLEKRIKSSKKMLNSYALVYRSYVDEGIHQASHQRNKIFQIFSALTAIFLPLNLLAAYMGMNIRIPYQCDVYNTLWPFSVIMLFCLGYFIFIIVLFKYKNWL